MQHARQSNRAIPRLLLLALAVNAVFAITTQNGFGGDGGGTVPIPPPQPTGPVQPPGDTLVDTTGSVAVVLR